MRFLLVSSHMNPVWNVWVVQKPCTHPTWTVPLEVKCEFPPVLSRSFGYTCYGSKSLRAIELLHNVQKAHSWAVGSAEQFTSHEICKRMTLLTLLNVTWGVKHHCYWALVSMAVLVLHCCDPIVLQTAQSDLSWLQLSALCNFHASVFLVQCRNAGTFLRLEREKIMFGMLWEDRNGKLSI